MLKVTEGEFNLGTGAAGNESHRKMVRISTAGGDAHHLTSLGSRG